MVKITELPAQVVPGNNDPLAIVDSSGAITKRITRQNLLSGAPLPSNTVTTIGVADSAITADKIANGSSILGYVEGLTGGQASSSATYVNATGITITFTTPASCTQIMLHAEGPFSGSASGTTVKFAITNGTGVVQIDRLYTQWTGSASLGSTFNLSKMITVTPNTSYTFKLMFATGGSGTFVINNGDIISRPTVLWAEKC